MRQALRFSIGVAALALAGCGVRVQNQTPTQFQANPDIGMYPLSATIKTGALVSQPVYLFQVGGGQKVPLHADATGTVFRTMYPVRCKSSFPVQYLAVWRVQGMTTHQKLFPAQPIDVQLTQAPLPKEAIISSAGAPKKGEWQGPVNYVFATAQNTNITGAKIEPSGTTKADELAAKAIRIVSTFPIAASCDTPTGVVLASRDRGAHANLVITTDSTGVPTWTTAVTFVPQPAGE
jgi:hypothetical protein